jgi:pyridoxine 5-phosphate synthase
MPHLGVNVDHVATIRQARGVDYPDPVTAAMLAELAGCHGIVAHLREDRRHIQERDIRLLRQLVKTKLNLEMAPTQEMVSFAIDLLPDQVCLVPERREELTTEGGLDVIRLEGELREVVSSLLERGIGVSLFIEPEPAHIELAKKIGAPMIELHTGRYCEAEGEEREEELRKLKEGAELGRRLGLKVNAGHGLNYQNVTPIAKIPGIDELNIGHSIVSRAVFVGMERAVKEMLELMV